VENRPSTGESLVEQLPQRPELQVEVFWFEAERSCQLMDFPPQLPQRGSVEIRRTDPRFRRAAARTAYAAAKVVFPTPPLPMKKEIFDTQLF
jgi:hypothetical protein